MVTTHRLHVTTHRLHVMHAPPSSYPLLLTSSPTILRREHPAAFGFASAPTLGIVNFVNGSVVSRLQRIYDEIDAVLPSPFVAIGGDEVDFAALEHLPEVHSLSTKHSLSNNPHPALTPLLTNLRLLNLRLLSSSLDSSRPKVQRRLVRDGSIPRLHCRDAHLRPRSQ
jgi:hypothetical protein